MCSLNATGTSAFTGAYSSDSAIFISAQESRDCVFVGFVDRQTTSSYVMTEKNTTQHATRCAQTYFQFCDACIKRCQPKPTDSHVCRASCRETSSTNSSVLCMSIFRYIPSEMSVISFEENDPDYFTVLNGSQNPDRFI